MIPVTTPDSIEFVKLNKNRSWIKANPPKEHPQYESFVSISAKEIPKITITTKKQRLILDFKVASQIYIDNMKFRYNKNSLTLMKIDELNPF